jgi:hypothetical protein
VRTRAREGVEVTAADIRYLLAAVVAVEHHVGGEVAALRVRERHSRDPQLAVVSPAPESSPTTHHTCRTPGGLPCQLLLLKGEGGGKEKGKAPCYQPARPRSSRRGEPAYAAAAGRHRRGSHQQAATRKIKI